MDSATSIGHKALFMVDLLNAAAKATAAASVGGRRPRCFAFREGGLQAS
jgi:hypothetical protein